MIARGIIMKMAMKVVRKMMAVTKIKTISH
jgi:hypothetical protein